MFIILAFKEHLANRNRSALFLVTMNVWVSFWPRKLSHARIGNVEVAVTKILVTSIFPPKTNNCNLILSLWSVLEPVVVFQLFYRCWLHKCNRICILSSAKCILLCLVWHICLFSSEEGSSYLSCWQWISKNTNLVKYIRWDKILRFLHFIDRFTWISKPKSPHWTNLYCYHLLWLFWVW